MQPMVCGGQLTLGSELSGGRNFPCENVLGKFSGEFCGIFVQGVENPNEIPRKFVWRDAWSLVNTHTHRQTARCINGLTYLPHQSWFKPAKLSP